MGKLGDGEKGDGKHQGDIREMQFNNGHGKFKMYQDMFPCYHSKNYLRCFEIRKYV